MATALELLNNVLRGLRRDVLVATSTTNSYHLLLLQFLNLAKERIEEQWDWDALRATVTVTLSAGTTTYQLNSPSPSDTTVSDRSRLLYEKAIRSGGDDSYIETSDRAVGSLPQVFDTTENPEFRLSELSLEKIERLHLTDSDETGKPTHFALYRDADNLILRVWPTPSGARTLKMRFVIPQAVIPSTGMSTYTLTLPSRPIWTSALIRAVEERGEEASRPLEALRLDADDALYLALDRERGTSDNTGQPL